MLTFGRILGIFITLLALGVSHPYWLKRFEQKAAEMALKTHERGYINMVEFQRRLEKGE